MTLDELDELNFEKPDVLDNVIISFGKFNGLDEIHKVDMKLFEAIPEDIGYYDGHEVNMDDTDGRFFAYGNNAEKLFKTIHPILSEFEFLDDAYVYLEFTKNDKIVSELEFKLNIED
jgi:hypothetical protein